MIDKKSLATRIPTLRVTPLPADTNKNGDIFGGWIMSQVDIAGAIAASKRAQGRVTTVAVNSFHFKKPVFVGDVVSCYAEVTKVGNTSITVGVKVYVERTNADESPIQVTEAILTYVAIDEKRQPRPVPK